jgi:hypothetical protein
MSRWRTEIRQHPVRALGPAALFALVPKCAVCLLAYAGLGAALGLRGPEICGATSGSSGPWVISLAGFGLALGIGGLLARKS